MSKIKYANYDPKLSKMITEQAKSITDEFIPIIDIVLTREDVEKAQQMMENTDIMFSIIRSKNPTTCIRVNKLQK